MLLDWFKRRRYRDNTMELVALLCPGTLAAVGGRHLKALFAKTMDSVYREIVDRSFVRGHTLEQTALAIVGALINDRIGTMPSDERRLIGTEVRDKDNQPTHPTVQQIVFVIDTAVAWERIAKLQRTDIDSFLSVAFRSVP
jgi:hypothetical protein